MRYWLIKSEPDVFSIEDLRRVRREPWDGVRNYQARNFMRDEMEIGDLALFYHSNTKPPGVAGIARVASSAYPDPTQWDPASKYFDEKSSEDQPRWLLVDFEFVAAFDEPVPLERLKGDTRLDGMLILRRGNRLSITPVEPKHFRRVCQLAGWRVPGR
jgi:predicted RNA-binding protein with PUA-like domain